VIGDPYPLWLDAIAGLVEELGLVVVGVATSQDDVIAMIEHQRPDMLITDVFADGTPTSPRGFLHRTKKVAPGMRTIVLSNCDDARLIDNALADGVFAYVLKTAETDDIASAIRQAFESSVYIGRKPPSFRVCAVDDQELHGLTKRECEILSQVAEGYSNAELARMLWVTEQTVKFHLSNIYKKLNVSNRTAASRWAQAHGLVAGKDAPARLAAVD
jgi:DNA-binding NarL/FixJ family response regulator